MNARFPARLGATTWRAAIARLVLLGLFGSSPIPAAAMAPLPASVPLHQLRPVAADSATAGLDLETTLARLADGTPVAASADDSPPREALRLYLLAREDMLAGRPLVAVTRLERARLLDPVAPEILRTLAAAYAAVGNDGKARATYAELHEAFPSDREALFELALDAIDERDFERGVAMLATARRGGPLVHDPGATRLADAALQTALTYLGYDRASIEAGRAAVEAGPLPAPSRYRMRLALFFRSIGARWQAIGDAACRLGAYEEALEAYAETKQRPRPDPVSLMPRLLHVHFARGNPAAAARVLGELITDQASAVDDVVVAACHDFARWSAVPTDLSDQIATLRESHPDATGLRRVQAAFSDGETAIAILRDALTGDPRSLAAAGDLIAREAARSDRTAIEATAQLLDAAPDLAGAFTDRLVTVLTSVEAFTPARPREAEVVIRVLLARGGRGEAWTVCADARQRWPGDDRLRHLQLELAGWLDEPALLRDVETQFPASSTAADELARARARLRVDDPVGAAAAAAAAVTRAGDDSIIRAEGELLQARAALLRAQTMPIDETRLAQFETAARFARAAAQTRPRWDAPLELLADLYRPDGPAAHPQRYRAVIDEIATRIGPGPLATRVLAADSVRRGDPELAIERVLRQYTTDPSDPSALRLVVVLWERFGPRGEAERWLRYRLETTADPHALDQLVRGLVSRDRIGEAQEQLEAWTQRRGSDPAIRRLREMAAEIGGDPDTAVELGLTRLQRRPPGSRRALEMAALLARNDRHVAALEHLQWIADTAADAEERHLLGAISVARRLGPPHEDTMTLTLVEATVRRFPAVPLPVYGAGLVSAAASNEMTRFASLARRTAERDPGGDRTEGVLAWRDIAQQLADRNRPDAAAQALRTRWEVRPPIAPDARALLASMIVVAEAACPDRAGAIIAWLEGLDAGGGIPALPMFDEDATLSDAYMGTSQLFTLLGDDAGSDELLSAAIRLAPDDAMALNNRGYARIEAGRNDPATVESIERAYRLAPEETSILDTIAWLRYKQGRFDDGREPGALTLLERVLARTSDRDPEVLDHYGDVLWRMGRTVAAVAAWREALERLDTEERRTLLQQQYRAVQSQGWGLLVVDPASIYDREDGARIAHLQEKLAAVEAGATPPVAPLFAELAGS